MSRRALVTISCVVVIVFAVAAGFYLRAQYVFPILMYHSVNPVSGPGNRLIVSPETFERQVRFLKDRGYRVMLVEELVSLLARKRPLPRQAVCITFDDGYKDTYTHAFPILKRFGIPATLFVIVREVGRADRVSWDELKEMHASGVVAIGSHAVGPDPLFKMPTDEELRRQVVDSKRILEEQVGREVGIFSYPEGMFDAKIRQAVVDAGYRGAVATNPGKGHPDDDIFALKRLRISEISKNLFVFWIKCSGFYTFLKENRKK